MSKVAKASTIADVACRSRQHFCLKYNTNIRILLITPRHVPKYIKIKTAKSYIINTQFGNKIIQQWKFPNIVVWGIVLLWLKMWQSPVFHSGIFSGTKVSHGNAMFIWTGKLNMWMNLIFNYYYHRHPILTDCLLRFLSIYYDDKHSIMKGDFFCFL